MPPRTENGEEFKKTDELQVRWNERGKREKREKKERNERKAERRKKKGDTNRLNHTVEKN